jgi:glutaredoxin-related protein
LPTTILKGLSISTSKLSPYLNNLLIINSSYEYISIQHSSKKLKMSLFDELIIGFSLLNLKEFLLNY